MPRAQAIVEKSARRKGKGKALTPTDKKRVSAQSAVQSVAAARGDASMFNRFADYIDTLYAPDASEDLSLAPCSVPHPAAPRRVPFDIDYSSGAANEVVVYKMYARPERTIVASTGAVAVPGPSTENAVFWDFEDTLPLQTTTGLIGRPTIAYGGTLDPDFELPFEAAPATVGGLQTYAIAASVGAAATLPVTVLNRCDYGMRVRLYQRDTVTGVWSGAVASEVGARGQSSFNIVSSANGSNGYALTIQNASDSPRALSCRLMLNVPSSSPTRVSLTYPASTSKNYSAITSSQKIDEFRTTAMSLMLTCMGDLTTTGGRVVCALVPREFIPDPNNIIGSIAALPIGAYDGKLQDGAHIIWQPRSFQDSQFNEVQWDHSSHYIIIAASLAKANTEIRIKGSYNYEIFSLDPSIGGMSYCPSAFGLNEVLNAVVASVRPGSSNDGHFDKVKRAAAAVAALAKRPLEWVIKNPGDALALAKRAAKIAATVAML